MLISSDKSVAQIVYDLGGKCNNTLRWLSHVVHKHFGVI